MYVLIQISILQDILPLNRLMRIDVRNDNGSPAIEFGGEGGNKDTSNHST